MNKSLHSSNIVVKSGYCLIYNLNAFEIYKKNKMVSFFIALHRIYDILWYDTAVPIMSVESSARFALPLFRYNHSTDVYTLKSPMFIWDDKLFMYGAEFTVTSDAVIVHTPDLVEPAKLVFAEFDKTLYTNYDSDGQRAFSQVEGAVLSELGITVNIEEANRGLAADESVFTYVTIYAPYIQDTPHVNDDPVNGTRLFALNAIRPHSEPRPLLRFDNNDIGKHLGHIRHPNQTTLIEFNTNASPFAYVTHQLAGAVFTSNSGAEYVGDDVTNELCDHSFNIYEIIEDSFGNIRANHLKLATYLETKLIRLYGEDFVDAFP